MIDCPGCGLPAEILTTYTLPSTDGPVEHLTTRCVQRHLFNAPAKYLIKSPSN